MAMGEHEEPSGARHRATGPAPDPDVPDPDVPDPDVPDPDVPDADAPVAEDHEPSPVRRRRISTAGAVVGLLVGLLAFALVVQVKSNTSGDTQLENARQDDLVRILSDLNNREQRLRGEITSLQSPLNQLGAGAQGRDAALAEARRRADELGILAGTLAAQGPGLRLVLSGGARPVH